MQHLTRQQIPRSFSLDCTELKILNGDKKNDMHTHSTAQSHE